MRTAVMLVTVLAAGSLATCAAQRVTQTTSLVCEDPGCTVAGVECVSNSDCCQFDDGLECVAFDEFCLPTSGSCNSGGAAVVPIPEGCLCDQADDPSLCAGSLECATNGPKAGTCQVRFYAIDTCSVRRPLGPFLGASS